MKLPSLFQFRILKLAFASLLGRAYTTSFPYKPYEPIKQFRGRPRYHKDDCIGCGACSQVCPSGCIDLVDEVKHGHAIRKLIHHLDSCLECGQCERYCTTEKGIKLTNEWDFVGFKPNDFLEMVEKELLICEGCGGVLAPIDQIKWLADRLGPLAFCNPTVMLVSYKELSVVDKGFEKESEYPVRARHINIQCPHCRRKSALSV